MAKTKRPATEVEARHKTLGPISLKAWRTTPSGLRIFVTARGTSISAAQEFWTDKVEKILKSLPQAEDPKAKAPKMATPAEILRRNHEDALEVE